MPTTPDRILFASRLPAGAARAAAAQLGRPVQRTDADAAAVKAVLAEGALPCLVHDGPFPESWAALARAAGVPWMALAVVDGEALHFRAPNDDPQRPVLGFSPAIAPERVEVGTLLDAHLRAGVAAAGGHPALERHLGDLVVRSLKARLFEPVVVDAFQNDRALKGGPLLAAGWALADWLRREVPEPRVGIVLPPGLGATLANLACLLAGKCPVNLNFTAGAEATRKATAAAGLRAVLTADAFTAKLPEFPWPERRFDLPTVLKQIGRAAVLFRLLRVLLTPAGCLVRAIGVPERGGEAEAGLLFTSGSSGDPKGVVLSHRNLIGNILQVAAILPTTRIRSLLACLPIFHSFGFTVTLWWPLAGGPRAVTYVSPLDAAKLAAVIQRHALSLCITTPTFLRALIRKAAPEQLRSLALVVTGAEKLPTPLLEEFEARFGVPVCEGYGMTEASPVISTNLTDDLIRDVEGCVPGRVIGSVGRPLPGVAVRVSDPETGAELPLTQTGMLHFRGPNVFAGYLNDPARSAEVLKEGWYCSGDIGRMGPDGFLRIEGRLSRFSKVAGEMVPHGTVESALLEALRGKVEGEFGLAVVGTRDAQKGEALAVLATVPIDADAVRRDLAAKGLPNLWIPKVYHRVDAVPTLASGKLDLRKCQELAERLQG